jgi:hypothetical protein
MATSKLSAEYEKARQEEQVARAAALRAAREALGRTPRERLGWLLDTFAYGLKVDTLTEADRYRLWQSVLLVTGEATVGQWAVVLPDWESRGRVGARGDRAKWSGLPRSTRLELEMWRGVENVDFSVDLGRYKVSADELRAAQQSVREAAEAVIGGRLYHRPLMARVIARLGPKQVPAPPTPRTRFALVQGFHAPLPDAAVMAALALVGEVSPTLLRRCPYRPDPLRSTECGRAFVGIKRQKWCPAHQETAKRERDRRAQQVHRERHQDHARKGRATQAARRRGIRRTEGRKA